MALGGTELEFNFLEKMFDGDFVDNVQIHSKMLENSEYDKSKYTYILRMGDLPEDTRYRFNDRNYDMDTYAYYVFNSYWQRTEFLERYPIPIEKCRVISHGIEPLDININKLLKTPNVVKLVYHSTPNRGLNLLVGVLQKLIPVLKKNNINIHLHVYSSLAIYNRPDLEFLYKELYTAIDNHPNMTNHGFVSNEQIRKDLPNYHIFAYPSIFCETGCRCLIEAMSAGCLCVHSSLGALAETSNSYTMMYEYNEDINIHMTTFANKLIAALHLVCDSSKDLYSETIYKQKKFCDKTYGLERYKTAWQELIHPSVPNTSEEPVEEPNNIIFTIKEVDEDDETNNETNIKEVTNELIFTCTTFIKTPENYNKLVRALDTFISKNNDCLHLVNKFLIVMEYTELNTSYKPLLQKKYPQPRFIFLEKSANDDGHSKSINIIHEYIKDYKYWLHWEESWYCIGPILKQAYEIIQVEEIENVQFTERDILYLVPEVDNKYLKCVFYEGYKTINAKEELLNVWHNWEINDMDWSVWKEFGLWPFYSLRPSISKTSSILKAGKHSEDPAKWPFQCEFEWALRWVRRNNIMVAIVSDIKVIRDETHTSTYTMYHYKNWEKKLETREKKELYNRNVNYHTFKSDKLKSIFFWMPQPNTKKNDNLKKFIFSVEEGFDYNGDNINDEIHDNNLNKYFVELTDENIKRFADYKKYYLDDNSEQQFTYCKSTNTILSSERSKDYDL